MSFKVFVYSHIGLLLKKRICTQWGADFPLIVALLKCGFLYVESYSTVQKLIFDDTNTNGMCLYQVMMTLLFLNDITNDAESTQKLIIKL